ncbi:hypothetical protein [Sorangium sp. So ce131]|uniref:hypothetical protein n=1 Tax=Sorangium sp. So ce131 TaxID=3133282 RepID=UPI003F60123E
MNLLIQRHPLILAALLLFVPVLTGAKGKGCQGSNGGGEAGAGGGDTGAGGGEARPCVETGCSGQICAEEGTGIVTTCEYLEEYACYAEHGICERGASGECGWRQTPELEACLGGGEPAPCVVTGCSGQICADEDSDIVTTCEFREEYACYAEHSVCERGASGECGWRLTPELEACIEAASDDRTPVSGACIRNSGDACTTDADCVAGGCGGDLCYNPAVSDGISTCECVGPELGCGCVDGTCTFWE